MKTALIICLFFFLPGFLLADTYVIIYATQNGLTGHCGIAVDAYQIHVRDVVKNGIPGYAYDSIKSGELIYFDLWPLKDEYKGSYDGDVTPRYYKLPSDHFKQLISVKTLTDQGIPHKFGKPCDALVAFPCTRAQDFQMMKHVQDMLYRNRSFNALHYNCCDFVIEALLPLTLIAIQVKEFIIKDYASTPNLLFRELAARTDIVVLKDPGDSVKGSFVKERVMARIFPILSIFQLFIQSPSML